MIIGDIVQEKAEPVDGNSQRGIHEDPATLQQQRKRDHLTFAQRYYDHTHQDSVFRDVRPIHTALPESSVAAVDTHADLMQGLQLEWPFYIEAMTGGSPESLRINEQLAALAAKYQLAMASGSQSIAVKHSDNADIRRSFTVIREQNPDGIVFANVGAHTGVGRARMAVEMLQANVLEVHVNAAQEIVMPEGDRGFYWLENIASIVQGVDVPVIVKEVGFGMSRRDIERLSEAGVRLINVGGRGGTNFVLIENARNEDLDFSELETWGQSTPEALLEAQAATQKMTNPPAILATGGVRSPLDVIKAGMLGACAVGVAGYFLNVLLSQGSNALDETVDCWQRTLVRMMTLLGCKSFSELSQCDVVLTGNLLEYAKQRHLR
ncbi:Isopentenyl diphosphate isomerase [Bifidobacterium magnum]|uniref:Isopentenyl-diphosphate delta-isomerase n=1 Tax=Bifidobacterium magnum TaxID=1692 RepID=A0A087BEY0_9BIFI|nr:Isopentenyl diphosphate isomerase [Bifidobacterium magnum]